jgi:DNA-binding transcriptional ArsR family regulator
MVVDVFETSALSDPEADRVFRALADSTRRDILARTIQREQSVSALARHYEMSLTAVQKHVVVLERAELVRKRRHGRELLVSTEASTLARAGALLAGLEHQWIQRMTQIEEILEEGEQA